MIREVNSFMWGLIIEMPSSLTPTATAYTKVFSRPLRTHPASENLFLKDNLKFFWRAEGLVRFSIVSPFNPFYII
jgi:hypothetical protein